MQNFWQNGYSIIRNVFDPDEIKRWRTEALQHENHLGDLLSHPTLWKVLFHEKLLEYAQQILGDTPVYFGDSSVRIGSHGRGYHKDNADRDDYNAPDWTNDPYTLIRFGIYLQDHSQHSGGLNIRKGSHMTTSNAKGRTIYANTSIGDLVVWNLRTSHSGNGFLLKGLPWLHLPPGIGKYLPHIITRDTGEQRVALFMTLAVQDAHLDRYLDYAKTRTYMVDIWKQSTWNTQALTYAKTHHPMLKLYHFWDTIKDEANIGLQQGYAPIAY